MGNANPRLLLDIDGVFVDLQEEFMQAVNTQFGTSYTYGDVTTYGYQHLTEEQKEWVFDKLWHDPHLYDEVDPLPEALNFLRWARRYFRVIACSSPMTGHIESKHRFLKQYFDRENIVLTSDKSLIPAGVAIDDGPRYVAQLAANTGRVYLMDRPWNRDVQTAQLPGVIRATNFAQIRRLLDPIEGDEDGLG